MRYHVWVRSPEAKWKVWTTCETREQGLSVGLPLLRDAREWNPSPPVRILPEGEPSPEDPPTHLLS